MLKTEEFFRYLDDGHHTFPPATISSNSARIGVRMSPRGAGSDDGRQHAEDYPQSMHAPASGEQGLNTGSGAPSPSRDVERTVPPGVVVLRPEQRIQISAEAGIFDSDETKIEGTIEHLHDGPQGRFSLALKELLAEKGVAFDADWDIFCQYSGVEEGELCRCFAREAEKLYFVGIDPEKLFQRSIEIVAERFDEFMARIKPVEGIRQFLLHCKEGELKLGICTGSSEGFMEDVLKHFDLRQLFDAAIYGAQKKLDLDRYSGNPVEEVCEALNCDAQSAFMVGDSVSDYATASLAGVPLVIIRLPKSDVTREQQLNKFFRSMERVLAAHEDDLQDGHHPNVVFVSDYAQVLIGEASPVARFTILGPEDVNSQKIA